jgi:hypothetical protein
MSVALGGTVSARAGGNASTEGELESLPPRSMRGWIS